MAEPRRDAGGNEEYLDVGEEVARAWAEIERWRVSQPSQVAGEAREVMSAEDCPPNSIGRTHPTVGDIAKSRGYGTIGGE